MINQPTGPTLLGFDVILVGTLLAGLAAFAVMLAIYAAVTIRDPMAKRVKALEARREQLKAGIVTSSSKKRTSLVRRTDTTDKMKDSLGRLNVLQESQIQAIQQKMAHAGYRNKEWAVLIIVARISHAIGMDRPSPNPFRVGGTAGTWIVLLVLSVWLLIIAAHPGV